MLSFVLAVLLGCSMAANAGLLRANFQSAGQDAKEAGQKTTSAAKEGAVATKNGAKKGANKAASATEKGARKVKNKTKDTTTTATNR